MSIVTNNSSLANNPSLNNAVDSLIRLGCKPTKNGDGYIAFCPIHESDGSGHKPSLTLKAGDRVPVVVNCHAGCDGKEILRTLGINGTAHKSASIVAVYAYRTEDGKDAREKIRYEPKDFRVRHRGETGEWIYKAGPAPAVLYRLPELRKAIAEGRTIFVAEGEKDCDRLAAAGLAATTNIEGAAQPEQKTKWKQEYTAQLSGAARVILLPDNDPQGRAHMQAIAAALRGKVGDIRILELPGLPAKGDVSDWLNQGHTPSDLKGLVGTATAVESTATPKPKQPTTQPQTTETAEPKSGAVGLSLPTVSPCTQLANAHRIRHYYKDRLWYALGVGWIMWSGKFWQPDPTHEGAIATGYIDGISRLIAKEASQVSGAAGEETDESQRKLLMAQAEALLKWAVQSENERTIAAGLKLTKHALMVEYNALNADPWLFNVQNGTVDLRTGALRPHDPADLITFIAPVTYDPTARCPIWQRFLLEVFAGDTEMVAFIQRAVGWSLTGAVKERALFFLYGNTGKNGKTTLVEALMKLVGTCGESSHGYGRKIGAETFMKSKNHDENQRKAATLAGPRFICTSEVDEDHRLNERLIKDITGGDTIEGRKLYQEAFTFKPQFKPWMYGNHKPEIRGTDEAVWSRVKLIPFDVSFEGREDLNLAEKLEAELPGILNWAIAGCLDWQRGGLRPPAKVQTATQEYRAEMDVFGLFFAECCVFHPSAEVWASDLWAAYRAWCETNGAREQSQTKLGRYLTAKGFMPENLGGRIKRLGIGLKSRHEGCDSHEGGPESLYTRSSPEDSLNRSHNYLNRHKRGYKTMIGLEKSDHDSCHDRSSENPNSHGNVYHGVNTHPDSRANPATPTRTSNEKITSSNKKVTPKTPIFSATASTCSWDPMGRLVTKCGDPEPVHDESDRVVACATCGESRK